MQIKQTFKRVVSQAFVRHAATLITGTQPRHRLVEAVVQGRIA